MADDERYRKDNKRGSKQRTKKLDIEIYHLIESEPRRSNKTRGGVAFYVKKSLKKTPRHFETEIKCTIIEVLFGEKI